MRTRPNTVAVETTSMTGAAVPCRLFESGWDVGKFESPVTKNTDNQRIDNRDIRRFGRSNHSAVDTAENDDRSQQCPKAAFKDSPEAQAMQFGVIGFKLFAILTVAFTVPERVDHQTGTDEDARQNASDKKRSNRLARGKPVHDEWNARRNDYSQSARNGNHRGDKFTVIPETDKQWNRHCADCPLQ